MSAPRPGSSSALIWCRPGPSVCTTWPVLMKNATSSAFTIACVNLRIVMSGHLKTIWPLRSSGTAMNSRLNSAMVKRYRLKSCQGQCGGNVSELLCSWRGSYPVQLVLDPEPAGNYNLHDLRRAPRRRQQGKRFRVARGTEAPGHDGVPVFGEHLPGRRRTCPGRGNQPFSTRWRLFRASCDALERPVRSAFLAEDRRRNEAVAGRDAAHRHRGERPGSHRLLAQRGG